MDSEAGHVDDRQLHKVFKQRCLVVILSCTRTKNKETNKKEKEVRWRCLKTFAQNFHIC